MRTVIKRIVECLQSEIPELEGLYLFGSRATGHAGKSSDWDIGYLSREKLAPMQLWELKLKLEELINTEVDLVDLYNADTVTQKLVIENGQQLLVVDQQKVAQFEYLVLSFYQKLNEERAQILSEIKLKGSIYG